MDPNLADLTTLSPKQVEALSHLLAGESVTDTARVCGIHRSTIYIWRQQEAFRNHFRQACVNRAFAIADQVEELTTLAIRNIVEVLSDTDHSPTVRLRAAKMVLDNALKPLASEFRHNSTKFDTSEVFVPVEPDDQPVEPAATPTAPEPEPAVTVEAAIAPETAPEPQPEAAAPLPVPAVANHAVDHAANLAALDNVINSVLARFLDDDPVSALNWPAHLQHEDPPAE